MKKQLSKTYSPKDFEQRIYSEWREKGYFHAEADKSKKPFTIVMPPPNITAQLHVGHALDVTFQDIIVRYKRMNGFCTLWLPGTDHASIATEAKIVAAMKQEGLTKDDVGRDGFLERAWKWKDTYGGRICEQFAMLGCSCDWDRLRFTMDEGCSKAVRKVFVDLYNEGLIYHGERIINWCPNCKTSISDIECEYEEQKGYFWHINYPLADGSGYIEIATTRPETLLGDSAVAVNPKDERYTALVGKTVILPLMYREIPIIADDYVDPEFGTGAVKITPAHDPNDYEVGLRHDLPMINIMNDDASINENGGKYRGLDRYEARKAVVSDLEKLGLLVKTEEHIHNVGTCQRCHTVVEPRCSKQWFVSMKKLAGPAIEAVKNGDIRFVPKHFENTYFRWMENIRDWCVSRQLWWGHTIPAYYCQNESCGYETVSDEPVEICPKCGAKMRQDEDTLDTWFSSALWPFSTLGWPDETEDYKYFYPTDVLVTGYDIIPFWVSRMIFSGLHYTGKAPFKDVCIHGMLRAADGRKMSKSFGNGIDPVEIINNYGTDALRLSIISGSALGADMRWSDARLNNSRNFANKLWNAARYILMNLPEDMTKAVLPEKLPIEDKWILSLFNDLVKEVTYNFEAYDFGVACAKLYDFIWDIYCDWYIELTKPRIAAGGETAFAAQNVLVYVMAGALKLLHPFMPFITEEIWHSMPVENEHESIMMCEWCKYDEKLHFPKEQEDFSKIIEAIRAVRNQRSELNVPPSKKAEMEIETEETELFESCANFFVKLAGAQKVTVLKKADAEGKIVASTSAARIFTPKGQLVDLEKEKARIEKEKAAVQKDIDFLSKKLSNAGFLAKAPKEQVELERKKLEKAEEKMKKLLND